MRLVQPTRDLNPVLERLVERQRAFFQPLGQGLALDVLHDEVVDAVLAPHVVEGADVRMVQLRDRLGLTLEPRFALRTRGEMLEKNLDRHCPVEARVRGFIDLAHTAGSNGSEDFVRA